MIANLATSQNWEKRLCYNTTKMIEIFTKIERAMVGVLVCKKSPEPLLIIILCSKDNKYSTKLCMNYTFECQVGCLVLLIVFPIGKSPIRKRFLHHSHEPISFKLWKWMCYQQKNFFGKFCTVAKYRKFWVTNSMLKFENFEKVLNLLIFV
jgi:hypothetical protein